MGPVTAQLYVNGCDVSLDPVTTYNVRANLAALAGRTHLLRPGDVSVLGQAPVLDGRGCLALRLPPGLWGAAGPTEALEELLAGLRRALAGGATPGAALTRVLPGRGAVVEGAPADWWLVPGGPLADIDALRRPRHVVVAGRRLGGTG